LKTGSIEEQLIADWMEDGLGFCLTTMLINVHQKEQCLPEVGKKAVYNTFHRLEPLFSKIEKTPQKADNQKLWAEARYNWVTHLLVRTNHIKKSDLPEDQQNKKFFDEKLLEEKKLLLTGHKWLTLTKFI